MKRLSEEIALSSAGKILAMSGEISAWIQFHRGPGFSCISSYCRVHHRRFREWATRTVARSCSPPTSSSSVPGTGSRLRNTRMENRQPPMQGHHSGQWLRQYGDVPADQQRRALQSDPQFRRLPPQRQQQLQQRLQDFSRRPPEQQQRILNRMETWEHLTPQQNKLRGNCISQFQQLPSRSPASSEECNSGSSSHASRRAADGQSNQDGSANIRLRSVNC